MAGSDPPFGPVDKAVDVELPIDDEWRARCKERLAELKPSGVGQDELAEHIGCRQSAISQVLSERLAQKTSKLAHAMSLALHVMLPYPARLRLLEHKWATSIQEPGEPLKHMLAAFESMSGIPVIDPKDS